MISSWRVAEIFGPTIQGEGRRIGTPCYFIRFGGCDLRCTWCDTPHAVLPDQVAQLPKMNAKDIHLSLQLLPKGPRWVVISGGNPALLDLTEVNDLLHRNGLNTMVETQGTVWRDWLADVDDVCVSPKPPSSGNLTRIEQTSEFLEKFGMRWHDSPNPPPYLKVVVFDDDDYEYARQQRMANPNHEFFLSVGNEDPSLPTVGNPNPVPTLNNLETTSDVVLKKLRWLMEKVAADKYMSSARVLPQLHTLAWGNERGR